jgi:hypothetical protein
VLVDLDMPAKNIVDRTNEIADQINDILNNNRKEKYFESVALLYSFIENLLKWLVFAEALWIRARGKFTEKDHKTLRDYCKMLNFYSASNMAYALGLIDVQLYTKISNARVERNRIIHKFWTYEQRGKRVVMRKKLEKLARIGSDLVGVFNELTGKIGVDEVYDLSLD